MQKMARTLKKPAVKNKTSLYFSWGAVVLVILACLLYHLYTMHKQSKIYDYLQGRIQELAQQKGAAAEKQEELLLEIRSQKDPAWVEMVLMKGLGLVPEGARKVYFTEE